MSLLNLLYQLKSESVYLWCNDEGKLAFSFDKTIGFNNDLKNQVLENKQAIIGILQLNQIDSEQKATQTPIWKGIRIPHGTKIVSPGRSSVSMIVSLNH